MSRKLIPGMNPRITLHFDAQPSNAAEIRIRLLKQLQKPASIELRGTEVQRLEASGLQVLASCLRDRHANGLGWQWLEVPKALRRTAKNLGLSHVMRFPCNDDTTK